MSKQADWKFQLRLSVNSNDPKPLLSALKVHETSDERVVIGVSQKANSIVIDINAADANILMSAGNNIFNSIKTLREVDKIV